MAKRLKMALSLDITVVALCFVAGIYWIIYALVIMPPIAVESINSGTNQSAGAQLIAAFGGAIGVAVMVVVYFVTAIACLVLTVVNLILVLRSHKLLSSDNASVSIKRYKGVQIAFYVMLFVILLLTVFLLVSAISNYFLPAFVLVAIGVATSIASLLLKRQIARLLLDSQNTLS